MFVRLALGFVEFVNKEMVASHVLVSEAHVVVIVDHNSEKFTFAVFVKEGLDGFDMLVNAILSKVY